MHSHSHKDKSWKLGSGQISLALQTREKCYIVGIKNSRPLVVKHILEYDSSGLLLRIERVWLVLKGDAVMVLQGAPLLTFTTLFLQPSKTKQKLISYGL